jgi:biopolymer transport protein ExbB
VHPWTVPIVFVAVIVAAWTPYGIAQDSATGSATVPAIASGQTATRSSQVGVTTKSLLKVVRDGGPLMIPIGLCSIALMVFVFERAISLRKGRIIPRPFVERFLEQLQDGDLSRETALELCDENNSPVARMFAAGVRKWGRPSVEVEQAILDSGERICSELRKYVRMMNGISTVTPLLGLLGTVFGMIQAFDAIAAFDPAQGDSKPLVAAGISQALITTAAGLAVAIPALIAYLYFVGRVDRRIVELDELGMEVVHCVSAEALAGANADRRAPSPRPRGGPSRSAA